MGSLRVKGMVMEQVSDNEEQARDGAVFPPADIDAGGPGETESACTSIIAHAKPSLTVEEQIAHLKSQGITFELCDEQEAADYLANANSYLRTRAYRVLYPRRPDGTYIGLDFAALRGLASLDRQLRMAFLGTCIDAEHFAKVKVLRMAEERGEDGYAVVADFLASLNHRERSHLLDRLEARAAQSERHDEYVGDLIGHYFGDMPAWVFLEALEFGNFATFYLFCARRWQDEGMRQEHYALKSTKALRNACAHNDVIVPGLTSRRERTDYQTNPLIAASLAAHGVRNTKSRRSKLSNLRMEQMASALFCLSSLCGREDTLTRDGGSLRAAQAACEGLGGLFPADGSLAAYFGFLWNLVDIWLPRRV